LIGTDSSASHLSGIDHLANTYSVMRHGQSKANVAGIIVSRIESDRHGDYGLSELGRTQALEAAQACDLPRDIVICSSDFSRARQTAEIVRAYLDAPGVDLAEALRERCFGEWEGSATDNYARVWAADESDSPQVGDGVEPTTVVLDRTTALIVDLERRYSGRHILLVSHGDTLQILQAGFLRMSPASHRSLPALQIAEIRQLRLSEEAAGNRLALRTPGLGLVVAHRFGAGGGRLQPPDHHPIAVKSIAAPGGVSAKSGWSLTYSACSGCVCCGGAQPGRLAKVRTQECANDAGLPGPESLKRRWNGVHSRCPQSTPRASRTTGSSSVPRPRQSSPGSRIFSAPRIDA
jgi:broad specificity phosphatase PhoE